MKELIPWIYKLSAPVLILGFLVVAFTTLNETHSPPWKGIWMLCMFGGMVLDMLIALCQRWLPRWFACEGIDWHTPDVNCECTRCGKIIDYL